jgi:hypothetical protein
MRAEVAASVRRLPASLASALGVLAVIGVWVLIWIAIARSVPEFRARGFNLTAVGVLLIAAIPVLYVSMPLSLTPVALLIEGRKAWDSVRYSFHLLWGSWWRIAIVYTVTFLAILAFYFVATIAAGVLAFSLSGANLVAMSASAAVVYVALGAIGLPFSTATMLAMFGELKVRREAVDLEARLGDVAARS